MPELTGAAALLVALLVVAAAVGLRLRAQGPEALDRLARDIERLRAERDALRDELSSLTGRTAEARASLEAAVAAAAPAVLDLEDLRSRTASAREALRAVEDELARSRRSEGRGHPTVAADVVEVGAASEGRDIVEERVVDLAAVVAAIGTGRGAPALTGVVRASRATEPIPAPVLDAGGAP